MGNRARVVGSGLEPKDLLAQRMEQTRGDELRDGAAGFEARVQAEPGVRPLVALGQLVRNVLADPKASDVNGAGRERSVVRDEVLTDPEHILYL